MTAARPSSTRTRRRPAGSAPPLSRERILQAAFEVAAEEGLARLSTRRLGERLSCQAMSIYHHFPSKHHLLDAMVDTAIGSLRPPPAGLAPIERLRRLLRDYRRMARAHAALYPLLAVHRLNTPTGVRQIEMFLGLVHDVVPDDELAARHFRCLGYYITGAALDETAGYARGPSAAEPVGDAEVAEHCPRLAAGARYFGERHWEATYELGLEALLARLEADGERLRASSAPRRPAAGRRRATALDPQES